MRPTHSIIVLGLLLLAPVAPLSAQPAVSSATPAAVTPGATVEVKLGGAKLSGKLTAWASFACDFTAITASKDGKSAVLQVKVASGVAPQIGGIIVGNSLGVAEPILIMVDDLPNQADSGKNHSASSAQAISFPSAVDGQGDGVNFDYYQFDGRKGQRVSLEIVAQRIGSSFDPVIRLLGPQGAEITAVDDTAGFGADCQLAVTLPTDGPFVIVIHDNQYKRGGRYRLRLGDFPVGSTPLPMGIRRRSTSRVQLAGSPQVVSGPSGAPPALPIAWRGPNNNGAACFELVVSDVLEEVEQEPNETFAQAKLVVVPCAVSGVLQDSNDHDLIRFAARKGRIVRIQARSGSLRSPSFVMMRVVDAKNKVLASAKVGASPEMSVAFTPPADGEYGVEVRDLLFRGGSRFGYRIELSDGPDFSLALKNEKNANVRFAAAANIGAVAFNVQCVRKGYDGPIELSLVDAPAGFRLLGNVIPPKATETRLVVEPPRGEKLAPHLLRLEGVAQVEGRPVRRMMTTHGVLRARSPAFPYPAAWRDGLLGLAVGEPTKPFFAIKAPNLVKCQAGAAAKAVELTLERKEKDFKTGLRFFFEPTPKGVAASVKEVKGKYTLSVSSLADAAIGVHKIKVHSVAEHKGKAQVQTVEFDVEVAPPSPAKPAT
jgi:hypothetical protein